MLIGFYCGFLTRGPIAGTSRRLMLRVLRTRGEQVRELERELDDVYAECNRRHHEANSLRVKLQRCTERHGEVSVN